MPIRTLLELESALDHLRAAPAEAGTLSLVVRRPERLERELLDEVVVDATDGVVGDNWLSRATSRARAEGRHLDAQVTVMSSRMIGLLGDTDDERALAGDQLYVDLDLSHDNLPPEPASRSATTSSSRSPPSRMRGARSSWPGSGRTPSRSSTARRAAGSGCAA